MKFLVKNLPYIILIAMNVAISNAIAQPQSVSDPATFQGLYIGGNLGAEFSGNSRLSTNSKNLQYCTVSQGCTGGDINSQASLAGATQNFLINESNFIGGSQFGYNLKLASHYLLSIETDIQGLTSSNKNLSSNTSSTFLEPSNFQQTLFTDLNPGFRT